MNTDGAKLIRLCKKDEIDEGSVLLVKYGELKLAVYTVENVFYVTDDTCTHGPGSLSEGYLEGHIIECDFHGGCFDIRDGKVTSPPCTVPLKTYAVHPDSEFILIEDQ